MVEYGKLLSRYPYAELRIERASGSNVSIKDGEVKNTSGEGEGQSVRVLINGSWGFASASRGRKGIEELLRDAERLSRLGAGKIKLPEPEARKKEVLARVEPVGPDEQVDALLEAAKGMKTGKVSSTIISCSDSRTRKEFYNSHGAEIIQETGYTYLSCSCIARSGDIIQRGSSRTWSRSGFGKIDSAATAALSRDKALRLLDAAAPPKGRFTVVLDPEMTGVFAHEALGHACESDAIVDRESILADKLGMDIGNELVTIVDDPAAPDFGQYAYDDEGVEGRMAVLVEKGVLKGYINSLETACELNHAPNGHARAEDYGEAPIVRMSNTYFQKGKTPKDEVFDVKSGVYLKGMRGGSVDIFSGGFMFKAEEAYEINGGELGKIMRDVTITGNILQTMLDVECVGDDFGTSPGICGKGGQSVPVSDGGPHIRVKNVAIG
ncbi:TldD/PmbA family protein [Candidatus Micrarchaeota archaeon]|nr:TldD/PmbA family protein [Candidatus Micrarchaeota archaeon]